MKRPAHPAPILLVLFASACSDDTLVYEPAELAELCGQTGPVQILPLDPARPLASVSSQGVFGDRRLLAVGYLGDTPVSSAFPPVGERELWSVGPCGEDPLLLANEQLRLITHYDQVGFDTLLVCDRESGQLSTLDPTGERPTNVVFDTHACFALPTDDGLLTIRPDEQNPETTGALVFQPWPDDPFTSKAEAIVLLDPVRIQSEVPHTSPAEHEILGIGEDDYFVVTAADELVAISRVDAALTTIATDVREFEVDSTGRYVVWQSLELTNDGPEWPEGPIFLLDRQTDTVTKLTEGALAYTIPSVFTLASIGILHLRVDSNSIDRFYRLPTLESIDAPDDIQVYRAIDDTRVLFGDYFYGGPYGLIDIGSGEQTTLFAGTGQVGVGENEIFVLDGVECCVADNSNRRAGKLLRIPYEGEPQTLAKRATLGYQINGNHVITSVDIGSDWVGGLIDVDSTTLEERLIDDHVLRFSTRADEQIEGDPLVVYTVVDPDRQGVWLARVAE